MIKVRMLVSRSGNDGAVAPGDVIDVPENEVAPMMAAAQCEPVEPFRPSRRASAERAVPADSAEKAI